MRSTYYYDIMKCLNLNALSLLSLLVGATALVHYEKMDKGTNGCKPKKQPDDKDDDVVELKVGGVLKDINTCGIYVCQNTDGDALIHYCQKPVPFEMCDGDGVSTVTPFPECCWKCVDYVSCDARAELSPDDDANTADERKFRKFDGEASPGKTTKRKQVSTNPNIKFGKTN